MANNAHAFDPAKYRICWKGQSIQWVFELQILVRGFVFSKSFGAHSSLKVGVNNHDHHGHDVIGCS